MRTKNYFILTVLSAAFAFGTGPVWAGDSASIAVKALSCGDVSGIAVSAVTLNSATVSWNSGSAASWDVAIGSPTDYDPSTLTFVNTTSPTLDLTDLDAGAHYKVWVRSVCDPGGNGEWIGPVAFTTGCDPVTDFFENFDSVATPGLANCWTRIIRGENVSVGAKVQTVSYNAASAPNTVEITNWGSAGDYDIMLVSPKVSNLAAETHRLRFTAKGPATLQVGTLDTNAADAYFTPYQDVTSTSAATEFTVDFDDFPDLDNAYIAIRLGTSVADNYIFLDNIAWEPIPACPDPTAFSVASVTPSTAHITWSATGTEASWDIAIGGSDDTDPAALTATNTTEAGTFTAENLDGSTAYKAWIRSVCADDATGVWAGPIHFTTDCDAVAGFQEDFDAVTLPALPACWSKILRGAGLSAGAKVESSNILISDQNSAYLSRNGSSGEFDIILVSPNLSALSEGTHRLRFFGKFGSTVEIGTLDSNTAAATFTFLESVAIGNGLAEYTVDFSAYTGTDRYIGFRIPDNSGLYASLSLDNIVWEPIPDCPEVTDVNVASVTAATAMVAWNGAGTETSWEVAYGPVSVTDPETLTPVPASESPFELNELSTATSYKVWVRTVCEAGNGAWVGPVTFTTECDPTVSFIQNFDTTATPGLPLCWSKILRGNGLAIYAFIDTGSVNTSLYPNFTAPNYIMMNAQGSEPTADIILVSEKVSSLPLATHRLKFDSFYPAVVQIGTLDGNTEAAQFTVFQTLTLEGFAGSSHVVNFDTYEGSDTYIGIRLVPDQNTFPSINLDNLVWEPIPSCPDVTQVSVPDMSQTSATISWTAGGDESSWEVAVGASTASDPNALEAHPASETSLTVGELTAATHYKAWVRSVCTGENGAWIGPVLFLTPCTAADLPYTEDFQSAAVPDLPACTTSQVTYSGSNNWVSHTGASNFGFPTKALRYYDSMDTANAWFFTRAVSLTAGENYTISYRKGTNSNFSWMGANLKVMYGMSPYAASMTTTLADHTGFYGTGVTETIAFTVPETGVYYFSFNVYSNAFASSVFLDDIVIQTALSTDGHDLATMRHYPNPVKDILTIANGSDIDSVAVYDVLGQQVLYKTVNAAEAKIDFTGVAKGTYFIRIAAGNEMETIKISRE